MTITNGANDPLPAERLRCAHCDEIIYRSTIDGNWMHWGTVQRTCSARTAATPPEHIAKVERALPIHNEREQR